MKYDHFSMLPEKAFQPRNGRLNMTLEGGGSGGGGGGGDSVQEQYISSAPRQFLPYIERALGKAEALSEAPYQTYGGERIAGATQAQQAARAETAGMQTPGQFTGGTGFIGAGGLGALQAGQYGPGQFDVAIAQAPNLRQFDMPYMQQQVAPEMQAAQTGFRPDLQQFQARGPQRVREGVGTFTAPGTSERFMSPYMQAVTDVQKQAAVREAQIAQQQANLGAARQGTYGGARQALAQAERERGLLDRLSNIQATGSQAAFDQAQKAFEAEQGRRLQAGLQTQQLGTQTGLANLQAQLGVQQLGTQTGLQTALANLDKSQQAAVQNQAAQLQTQGLNADQALRTALANQQAALGVQQLGAQQGLQAQLANQQAMLEAQRMAEQSRQYGAGLGLQGAQTSIQAGQALGQIGTAQQAADLARLQAQEQAGARTQAESQRALDTAYQDFLAQQRDPYQQLEFMRTMVSGVPLGQAQQMYQAPQSQMQNLMQLGLGGLGLYGAYGGFR